MSSPICPHCAVALDVGELLAAVSHYSIAVDYGIAACAGCARPIELRVRMQSLMIGFTYWGGALHFDPQETCAVDDLVVMRAPNRISVRLGDREILLPTTPR